MERAEFLQFTKHTALSRQHNKCASCGVRITSLGQMGKRSHKFGEGVHAHHMVHCQRGGTNLESNCVILCESCHYSAHEGGYYRNKADYMMSSSADYKFFNG